MWIRGPVCAEWAVCGGSDNETRRRGREIRWRTSSRWLSGDPVCFITGWSDADGLQYVLGELVASTLHCCVRGEMAASGRDLVGEWSSENGFGSFDGLNCERCGLLKSR